MRRRLSLIVALCAAAATLFVSATAAQRGVGDTKVDAHTAMRAAPLTSALLSHAKRASTSPRHGLRTTPWFAGALALLVVVVSVCLGHHGPLGPRPRSRLAVPARAPPAF